MCREHLSCGQHPPSSDPERGDGGQGSGWAPGKPKRYQAQPSAHHHLRRRKHRVRSSRNQGPAGGKRLQSSTQWPVPSRKGRGGPRSSGPGHRTAHDGG